MWSSLLVSAQCRALSTEKSTVEKKNEIKHLYAKARYILLLRSKSKSRSRELRRPPARDRRDIGHRREALQCINRCLYYIKIVGFIRVRADHTFNSFGRVGFKCISVEGKRKNKTKRQYTPDRLRCNNALRYNTMIECDWNECQK